MRRAAAGLLLLAAGLPTPARPQDAPPTKPLPVGETAKLQDPGVFTIDGTARVPKGVEVTVFQGITIRGIGARKPAVLEVEGGFDCVGTYGKEVVLEDVLVRPVGAFDGIRFDNCVFRGSGGIGNPQDRPTEGGTLRVELTDFLKPCGIDLTVRSGWVDLASSCFEAPIRVRGSDAEVGKPNRFKFTVRRCDQNHRSACPNHGARQGILAGLEIDSAAEIDIGSSHVAGDLFAVRDWRGRFLFNGNKVEAARVEWKAPEPGRMGKIQCARCDFYVKEILVYAPPKPGVGDSFTMDRCWFRGITDPDEVQLKVIRDGSDVPQGNGAKVILGKVLEEPEELGGPAPKK